MDRRSDTSSSSWRSSGFRLAVYYGFLVTVVMVVTVAIIYMRTAMVFYHRMEHQAAIIVDELKDLYATGGSATLVQTIERHLADGVNDASEIFLLVGPDGRKVTGNLDAAPQNLNGRDRRLVIRSGKPIMAYLSGNKLSDGSVLYVGSDLQDQDAFEALVAHGIGVAVAVAFVLLLAGLFVFRQQLDRSIAPLRRALHRVASGEVEARVPPSRSRDEFALLGDDINRTLERIETLMNGVQHVSNTIAHNLRTPLTRVMLRMRAGADDTSATPEQRAKFEQAAMDIEDLVAVFEKLLHIAEAEAGAGRIPFVAVDVPTVVAEVLDFYEVMAEQTGTQLLCEMTPGSAPHMLGDPTLLAQALSTLVDNALKYAGPGARIAVEVGESAGTVSVAVRDNGPGVAPQHLSQLGQRFFRLDRDLAGHGLGLSAVAAIVASHGGTLHFQDAAPGLRVRMDFPSTGT